MLVNGWIDGWGDVKSLKIKKSCLKIYDLWQHPTYGWVDGLVSWWVDGFDHVKSLKIK